MHLRVLRNNDESRVRKDTLECTGLLGPWKISHRAESSLARFADERDHAGCFSVAWLELLGRPLAEKGVPAKFWKNSRVSCGTLDILKQSEIFREIPEFFH